MKIRGKRCEALLAGVVLLTSAGCLPKKSDGFEGGSRVRTPRPSPTAMPGSALPPEQKCKVAELRGIQIAGGTSNGLQTAFVDQSQMSRKVLIDLSLGPCTTAGAPPVKLETRFDIDADWVTASGEKLYDGFTLPYSVLSGGTNLGSGRLVLRRGQDLFGNAGEKYFMLASDVALGIPAATEAATLVIDLSSTKIKSRDPAVSGTFQVPLYVQAGAVQPIKGMVSVRGQ